MKLTPDWYTYLHNIRKEEIDKIFYKCPENLFNKGLEIGGGDGFQSILLRKCISFLISTDINLKRLPNRDEISIKYFVCDAENIGNVFKQEEFDIIFSSNLLEHIINTQKVLKSIYKIMKDDGITIHIMPNPFWKIYNLILKIPYNFIYGIEIILDNFGLKKFLFKLRALFNNEKNQSEINNPKIKKRRSFLNRLLIPKTHGVSDNHIKEFFAFRKSRWINEFKNANFEILRIISGPVASGYGFGLNRLRNLLKRMNLSSEYIYIAKKKDFNCSYEEFF